METFVTALISGAFALGGGWLGGRLSRTNEHKQWLRNRKLEAYMEFLETARPLNISSHVDKAEEINDELRHVLLKVQVFGSEEVRQAASSYYFHSNAFWEWGESVLSPEPITPDEKQQGKELAGRTIKAVKPLVAAIRNDLEASTGAELGV